MHQGKTLWVALVAVAAAALFTLGTQSAPLTPDAVEALLPKFCSYKVDVSALKSPYVAFDKATGHETVTCPFVAGVTKEAMSYAPRGNAPCTSRDLPGLTIVSAMEISGRNARTAERCALGHRAAPPLPDQLGGQWYFVRYVEKSGGMFALASAMWVYDLAARTGAPFARFDVASVGHGTDLSQMQNSAGDVLMCFQMLPGTNADPVSFLKGIGHPLPNDTKEEKVVDCRALLKARGLMSDPPDGQTASEFGLWLEPSSATPDGYSFPNTVRAALQKLNVVRANPKSSSVSWQIDKRIVVRSPDGAMMAVIGGERQTMFDIRALTSGTCEAVYAVASRAHLFIVTSQTNRMALTPPNTPGSPPERDVPKIPVADADDLCILLKPGFAEWRAEAPPRPADLHDLDNQDYGLHL